MAILAPGSSFDIPMIILGVEKELSLFTGVSKHVQKIVDNIAGSYNYDNEKELADIIWPFMRSHLENKRKTMVKNLRVKLLRGLVSGYLDCHQGRKSIQFTG